MDIKPIMKGHTLVIPRAHHDSIINTPNYLLRHLIVIVRKIARALIDGLGVEGVNITQANGPCAGQIVPHIHFHIIPRVNKNSHSRNWKAKSYDSLREMESYAEKIRSD